MLDALSVTLAIAASLLVNKSIVCTALVVSVAGGVIKRYAYEAFDGYATVATPFDPVVVIGAKVSSLSPST